MNYSRKASFLEYIWLFNKSMFNINYGVFSVLKNFAKFTGKHLCQSLFFNKAAGLRPAVLLKKRTLAQVFVCEFFEIL